MYSNAITIQPNDSNLATTFGQRTEISFDDAKMINSIYCSGRLYGNTISIRTSTKITAIYDVSYTVT